MGIRPGRWVKQNQGFRRAPVQRRRSVPLGRPDCRVAGPLFARGDAFEDRRESESETRGVEIGRGPDVGNFPAIASEPFLRRRNAQGSQTDPVQPFLVSR